MTLTEALDALFFVRWAASGGFESATSCSAGGSTSFGGSGAGGSEAGGSGWLGRSAAWPLRARVRSAIGSSGRRGALGTGPAEGGGSIEPIAEAARASGEAGRVGAPARQKAERSIVEGGARVF